MSQACKSKRFAIVASALFFLMAMAPESALTQVNTITLNSLSVSNVCAGRNLDVNFSSNAIGTNTYTVQLSDNAGSFATPTDIGFADFTDAVSNSNINVTIPSGTAAGSGYLIRVVSGAVVSDINLPITVDPDATINLTSAVGTDVQTVCINTVISDITYSTTGATGATFSGLPAGVTGNWAANVVTISGSPTTTVGSPFNYTVTLTGGCGNITATGSITVTPNNTITLTSAAGTDDQTVCISTAITNITYSTTGATGATFSGLPAGVTGNWAGNVVTISGSPTTTVGSPFNYTVTLTGGCGNITATGSITVTPNNTITLTSAAGTDDQTLCINTALINITYNTTGATGATFSGLPAGVTGNWAANVVTISGSPTTTVGSPFNYTVTLTGGCGNITATGTITVNDLPSVSTPSSTLCVGSTMTLSPTSGGTWISSNTARATVTNAGVVTGVAPGSVTFTFTDATTNCNNTTSAVTVNALPVLGGPTSVCVGGTIALTPSTGGTWVSNDPTKATITSGGVVTGVAPGSVTFTFTDGTTNCSNTTSSVTVNALPVLGGPASVCVGSTINLTPATGGTWVSSDPTKATINNAGLITGVAAGTVTFTFTQTTTGCSNTTSSVTVNAKPVVTAPATVCVGSTATLSPTTGVSSN